MRILVGNWGRRLAGGTETYLGQVMSRLAARGHEIGFCFEADEPEGRPLIPLPSSALSAQLRPDTASAIDVLRSWRPDVIYAHGFLDPEVEAQVLGIAPAVFVAHSYYGTCVSGEKTHKFPVVRPCSRVFGVACLALYFPRRCGGLSPISMLTAYERQRRRLGLLHRYAAVITPSAHMSREFLRHGIAANRVHTLPHGIDPADDDADAAAPRERWRIAQSPVRLAFVGRMDRLKGGRALLEALPRVQAALGRPIHLTFAGEGPARESWERHAVGISAAAADLTIEFTGWLPQEALAARLAATDVVVVPSQWPEPFGLAGLEANRRGLPVVAYATGGIPEWLHEGVNGCLAPGDPPTVQGLAEALTRCLRSLEASDALNRGALAVARVHHHERHLDALLEILEQAAGLPGRVSA
jgi:glycosyltransferase involved in cell wall biosynthesis